MVKPIRNFKRFYSKGLTKMRTDHTSNLGKKSGIGGFTLIEVLIAMAIFSIGILAVGTMQLSSAHLNAAAGMQTEATNLAVERIESLAVLPYDHEDLDENNSPQQIQSGSYTIVWTVVEALDMPMKTITVTVSSSNPNARDVSVSTIKAQGS
jgi:type IV pilus assembly protein PilV